MSDKIFKECEVCDVMECSCSNPEKIYEQGRADMWNKMKKMCEGKAYFDGNNAAECKDTCAYEHCPIAKGG